MTKRSFEFRQTLSHKYGSMMAARNSRKFFLWLVGLGLAVGSITLAQAGQTQATPAANGTGSTSVSVSTSAVKDSPQSNSAKTDVSVSSNQSKAVDDDSSGTATNTQVTVNGKSIPVPKNGSVHKTVPGDQDGASVTVDVQNNSQGSSSNQSSSSSNITVFGQSSNISSEVNN
ncbi:MAG: hypothetical protein ACXWLH_04865 [Candidatus Saccharimonadales bacterium]